MELVARFVREHRAFNQPNGSRFIIGRAAVEAGSDQQIPDFVKPHDITVIGDAQPGKLVPGLTYTWDGKFDNHARYGPQFKFRGFTMQKPHGRDGVIRWLQTAPSIGPVIAAKIWDKYGSDSISKLKDSPDAVADSIRELNAINARRAAEYLIQNEDIETAQIELGELFSGHKGLHAGIIRKLIETYGVSAADQVKENPFVLLQFPGVAFPTAYRVWCELGYAPDDIEAQVKCVSYTIEKDMSHTHLTLGILDDEISRVISAQAKTKDAIERGRQYGELAIAESNGRTLVTTKVRSQQESSLSASIKRLMGGMTCWPAVDSISGLTNHQRLELARAIKSPVGILVGSPGTGKTYTLSRLVKAVAAAYGPHSVACLSFTNKASIRAAEMLKEIGVVNGAYNGTIHRALCPVPGNSGGYDGSGWKFAKNKKSPLAQKFLILEEASMNNLEIMHHLFEAIKDGANVLIVGDENQLPPVGNGAFLRDMMARDDMFGTGRLREIHRNKGMIEAACASIRDHGTFQTCSRPDLDAGLNLMHIECRKMAQVVRLKKMIEWVKRLGGDPIWDMQVIVSVNEKTPVSRVAINRELQAMLNHSKEKLGEFKVGDKVIHRKKNAHYKRYDREVGRQVSVEFDPGFFVFNGQMGKVVELDFETEEMVVDVDGDVCKCKVKGTHWALGYGITSHASQGSQWPFVAVMIDESYGAKGVMSREWFTTAVSRAQQFTCTIGPWSVVEECCKRVEIGTRITRLQELL